MAAAAYAEQLPDLQLFKKAIECGDVDKAMQLASQLASQKTNLKIEHQAARDLAASEIEVKIYLEDKYEKPGGFLQWKVYPSVTIKQLKERLEEEQELPQQVQKWIIGKNIRQDTDTLQSCGIKSSGASVYVYLLSASKVGLTREQFENRKNQPAAPAGLADIYDVPRDVIDPAVRQPTPPLQDDPLELDLRFHVDEVPAAPQRVEMPPEDILPSITQVGWRCPTCTLANEPTRPGCEMCGTDRPADYMPPQMQYRMTDKERKRLEKVDEEERLAREQEQLQHQAAEQERDANYQLYVEATGQKVIRNNEEFPCAICFDDVPRGGGIVLRECLHQFCIECLEGVIETCEEAEVKCPFQDAEYNCPSVLLDVEIKAIVTEEEYLKHLSRGLSVAESTAANSYHCKSIDCQGWCYYDDDVNFFTCPICTKKNCLTCKAIHEGQDCKEYQEDLRLKAQNDVDARKTQEALEKMLTDGDAMECPQCKVVITKKVGCDWLRCSVCKTEICWVTKGRRWGPGGPGDTSGGCRCDFNRKRCHPKCGNCH